MREGVEWKGRAVLEAETVFAGVCEYPRFTAVCYQGNCSM